MLEAKQLLEIAGGEETCDVGVIHDAFGKLRLVDLAITHTGSGAVMMPALAIYDMALHALQYLPIIDKVLHRADCYEPVDKDWVLCASRVSEDVQQPVTHSTR